MADPAEIAFDASECAQGGVLCGAWGDWFWASVEADPTCDDEDRDPLPLQCFPFNVRRCLNVGSCALGARAIRTQGTSHEA